MALTPPRALVTAPPPSPPAVFTGAVASVVGAALPPAVALVAAPAPARIAPFAAAWSLELGADASGRLVYLHDPDGQPAWGGRDRLVAFARVVVDAAMADDPLLADVVWEWLQEGLAGQRAEHSALGGTVTTTASRRYGSLAHLAASHEAELRCSWTPAAAPATPGPAGLNLAPHVSGFLAAVLAMAGLPPSPTSVPDLP